MCGVSGSGQTKRSRSTAMPRAMSTDCALSYRLIHEPREAPDSVLHGRRLVLAFGCCCCCCYRWPPLGCCSAPTSTTPSHVSSGCHPSVSSWTCSTTCTTTSAATTNVLVGRAGAVVHVVLPVRTVPAAAAPGGGVARSGGIATAAVGGAAISSAVVDGAVVVRAPCAVRVRHP